MPSRSCPESIFPVAGLEIHNEKVKGNFTVIIFDKRLTGNFGAYKTSVRVKDGVT